MIRTCGKMALLDRLLKALRKGGSKVLIFSQARPDLLASKGVPFSLAIM